jgi:hypothetical protein
VSLSNPATFLHRPPLALIKPNPQAPQAVYQQLSEHHTPFQSNRFRRRHIRCWIGTWACETPYPKTCKPRQRICSRFSVPHTHVDASGLEI